MARSVIRTKHKIVARVEAELLRQLRLRDGLSRVELARQLKLAPSTAGIYVDRLLRDRFIVESHKADREQGRPPTLLVPNPDGGRFVGVDFEARNIRVTVVDFSQRVIKQVRRAIREDDSVERILVRIEETIRSAIEEDERPLLGIGVGVPGVIDPVEGVARSYDFIPGWKDIPLARRLSGEFGVPVYLEHNIRSRAMAELWFGQGLGLRNFVCLGVRTGIGAGLVADGRLLRGEHGSAGEIGKWHVPGPPRGAAARGFRTLEDVASLPAILAAAEAAMKTRIDFPALKEAVTAGERKVLSVLERTADFYGGAIHQLQLLFDPYRVVLAGPLAELGSTFLELLREAARRRSPRGQPEIVNSALGQFNGAVGAAALALHQWQPAR
jgi:glucokinase